jgi:hypothetical protein
VQEGVNLRLGYQGVKVLPSGEQSCLSLPRDVPRGNHIFDGDSRLQWDGDVGGGDGGV